MSSRQARVIASLGAAQTLAWASSYYLPAILANPMAAELGLTHAVDLHSVFLRPARFRIPRAAVRQADRPASSGAGAHVFICLPLNALLPTGTHASHAATNVAPVGPDRRKRWAMAALAFVFAGTWFGSTAMAAHLPRVLQEAGATLPVAIAAPALVGPAQVAARVLEFWLMRQVQPIVSAQIASLAHPVGAGLLLASGAPAAPVFTIAHGAGNGVMTIANGTLPLHLFGAGGYGLRQGLLMMPARFLQAAAPFVFDVLLSRVGTAALGLTAAFGVASFLTLAMLRRYRSP